jgi:hypothetical protein
MVSGKKWIQGAVHKNKKGTFTKHCKAKGYSGVTDQCIKNSLKSKNKKTQARAKFANAMRK